MQSIPVIPFRWDVSRREQLGRLPDVAAAESYTEFMNDLRRCAARVIALVGDADLIFVGRSPESLFDYLSGVVHGTAWPARMRLLNVSMRDAWCPRRVRALRGYLASVGLAPTDLLRGERPAALVDLVWSGGTLANLVGVLFDWCREARVGLPGVARKLVVLGIAEKGDSTNWRENHEPLRRLPMRSKRCVGVAGRLWHYLGETQPKVACSYPPERWGDVRCAVAPSTMSDPHRRSAVRLALDLHRRARTHTERETFVAELTQTKRLASPHVRGLIRHLRTAPHSPAGPYAGPYAGPPVGARRSSSALIPPHRFVTFVTDRDACANTNRGRNVLIVGQTRRCCARASLTSCGARIGKPGTRRFHSAASFPHPPGRSEAGPWRRSRHRHPGHQ